MVLESYKGEEIMDQFTHILIGTCLYFFVYVFCIGPWSLLPEEKEYGSKKIKF